MRKAVLIAVIVFVAPLGLALAQGVSKPGLWEVASKMSSPTNPGLAKMMEDSHKAIASMPPAQRKQMEDTMAQRGLGMSFGAGGVMTMKICITPEMANRPPMQQRPNCVYKHTPSGQTHDISFQCSNPPGDGAGQIVFADAENYSGTMRTNTLQNGKKETVDAQMKGKFLGADCGDIKPLPMPKGG